jgi:hypothetical protein
MIGGAVAHPAAAPDKRRYDYARINEVFVH